MNEVLTLNMANPSSPSRIGSIAALVGSTDGETRFFLTCSHVALGGSPEDKGGALSTPVSVSILERGTRIGVGQLTFAQRNSTVDVGLVQVIAPLSHRKNILPNGIALNQAINRNTLNANQKVGFYSSLRGKLVWGKVIQAVSNKTIALDYGSEICEFRELVVISGNSGSEPLSKKGDSGSILFTEDFSPFGILIGGNERSDYAIALTDVLQLTNTKII